MSPSLFLQRQGQHPLLQLPNDDAAEVDYSASNSQIDQFSLGSTTLEDASFSILHSFSSPSTSAADHVTVSPEGLSSSYLSDFIQEGSLALHFSTLSSSLLPPAMKTIALFFLGLLGSSVSSLLPHPVPRQDPGRNDGIHLVVHPICGPLDGPYADVNAGLVPQSFKTIVSFGDSYTDGGIDNGSALLPPVLIPPNPEAGGRSTNGPVWIEGVASDIGATLMDYAQWGACTDLSLWPSNPRKVDFLGQMQTFLGQNHTLDPDTTLYSIFFGINDYLASLIDGNHMPAAAQVILDQISILSSPPTNGKSFLVLDVYGRGTTAPQGEAFKQQIYDGLNAFHKNSTNPLNVAYVDFEPIWNGVLNGDPGYQAFGYSSPDQCTSCTQDCNQFGWCKDGEHHFYWIDGHPSKETHRIMADFVDEVLSQCKV